MTLEMLMALLPLLILGGVALVLMAMVSFWRNHTAAVLVTLAGSVAALVAAVHGMTAPPVQATPLLQVEPIGLFFVALFSLAAIGTTLFSHAYLSAPAAGDDGPGDKPQPEEYYMLLAIATLGASVLALSGHFTSFVLGLEILSIALYGMIAYPEEGNAPIEAAVKYLVLSGVATATMLFGMALVYASLGSMNFAELGMRMSIAGIDGIALAGNAMILVGVAFKLSLVPFHMWTPDVYEGAPAPVTGLLASIAKAAMVIAVLRYVSVTSILNEPGLFNLVATLGMLSMVIGNLLALQQQNVKRLLAYSSIAHVGYLMLALPLIAAMADGRLARELAIEAAMLYLTAYVITSVGAFGVVGLVSRAGTDLQRHDLQRYRGLFWRQPVLAGAFTLMLMSLAGLPVTMGFITKFYLVSAGIQGQLWLLVWALILGSAIGAYYYLRIMLTMLAAAPATATAEEVRMPAVPVLVVAVIGMAILALGVYPTPLIGVAHAAMSATFGQ
jgi:NADH-quinone oxidoreductase subunit N